MSEIIYDEEDHRLGVHRTAFVASGVRIGRGTVVGPNSVILGPCVIGENCWIGPNVTIGTTAQDLDNMIVRRIPNYYFDEDLDDNGFLEKYLWDSPQGKGVVIGNNTIIRENSAIQQGTIKETYIGNNVFLMHKSHIGHDVFVGDSVSMAPSTNIAGHCSIFELANLGMATVVHQRAKIGAGCMIGMNSTVTKDTNPFEIWYGSPARNHGLNTRLLSKMLFTDQDIKDLQYFYKKNKKMPSFVVEYIEQMKDS